MHRPCNRSMLGLYNKSIGGISPLCLHNMAVPMSSQVGHHKMAGGGGKLGVMRLASVGN